MSGAVGEGGSAGCAAGAGRAQARRARRNARGRAFRARDTAQVACPPPPRTPRGAHAKPMPKPTKKSTRALKLSTILQAFLLMPGQQCASRAEPPTRRPPSSRLSDMAGPGCGRCGVRRARRGANAAAAVGASWGFGVGRWALKWPGDANAIACDARDAGGRWPWRAWLVAWTGSGGVVRGGVGARRRLTGNFVGRTLRAVAWACAAMCVCVWSL